MRAKGSQCTARTRHVTTPTLPLPLHARGWLSLDTLVFKKDEASNPLDGVRDLIVRNGAGVFNSEILGQIDDLLREAGTGVYGRVGPILGEVRPVLSHIRQITIWTALIAIWTMLITIWIISGLSCD